VLVRFSSVKISDQWNTKTIFIFILNLLTEKYGLVSSSYIEK